MDVFCPRCGEPWDTYEFSDVRDADTDAKLPRETVRKRFRKIGCASLDGERTRPRCAVGSNTRSVLGVVALDMATDLDDVAADLDDIA